MGWKKETIETLFRIYNKQSQLVDFILTPAQTKVDELLDSGILTLDILKSRQQGCSSYIMARFLAECMESHQVVAMLAHDKEHTEKLLRRAQEFLSNVKGAKPAVERSNANEIYFKKTQSTFYIGTAGSKDFGRSATITRLHCSELAFWKDPKTLFTGLLQAVPFSSGIIVIETTANGWGNFHQKSYYRKLANPANRGFPLFLSWSMDPDCISHTPFIPPLTEREAELIAEFSLSIPQIQWRREKLDQMDGDENAFMQEYPLSVKQAFIFSGAGLFNNFEQAEVASEQKWETRKDEAWLTGHPVKGYTYVAGADSSGGTGNDEASIVVGCLETKEQVYEFHNNETSPPAFARKIIEVGFRYNTAYLVPESNSHGLSVIAIMKERKPDGSTNYPLSRIYRNSLPNTIPNPQLQVPSYSYGWRTGALSKPYMVGMAVKFIEDGFKVYSPLLYDQLKAFAEDPQTGKLEGSGDHDDVAIAFMLMCMGFLKPFIASMFKPKEKPPVEVYEDKRKVIDMSKFRDEKGSYLLPFADCFPTRNGKKNPHTGLRGRAR
jgi:hypothetical protein